MSRWLLRDDVPRGDDYDQRWRDLADSGEGIHGEADLIGALSAGGSVLDAGCGTGRVAIELARRGHEVVGVDLDPGMLDTARAKAPELEWHLADLLDVDLARTFDLVALPGNVMIFLSPGTEADVVANMARHLATDGRLVTGFQLGEVPRCRQVYLKYLEWDGANCAAWIAYAELEASLGELDRCRSLFELAIAQPSLDMPESLWKAYIDFEIGNEEWERTRALYRALLERSKHPKVWVAFAQFERRAAGLAAAGEVYAEAEAHCREAGLRDERALLLESWRELEAEGGL